MGFSSTPTSARSCGAVPETAKGAGALRSFSRAPTRSLSPIVGVMEIIPAIDLKDGRCVRLYQGDFRQVTVYSEDPTAVARQWSRAGAPRLHVVDLDGARAGTLVHLNLIHSICAAVDVPVQCGGGVRTEEDAQTLLRAGADRVVIGTAAVTDPDLVGRLLDAARDRIVVALDAQNGLVASRGWEDTSGVPAANLARAMADIGVRRFLYTDIGRDGTLTEPNFEATGRLVDALRGRSPGAGLQGQERDAETQRRTNPEVPASVRPRVFGLEGPFVLASGGVSTVDHLRRLAALKVEGTIVGRALYSGRMRLEDALAAMRQSPC